MTEYTGACNAAYKAGSNEGPIIVVTGGLGFIGSHIVVALLEQKLGVPVIIDNLSNSKIDVLDRIEKLTGTKPVFHDCDLCDYENLLRTFEQFRSNRIEAVIHLAGLKAVNESIQKPIEYYQNNLVSTLNLIRVMEHHKIYNLIFSSSATVYGSGPDPIPDPIPRIGSGIGPSMGNTEGRRMAGLSEEDKIGEGITNPYGMTKYMIELILKDLKRSDKDKKWKIISLRYFNPAGAHRSGLIGEDPLGIPNNLMPIILNSIRKKTSISIFGNDYDTPDGTCIRDYIHVVDLANAHLYALRSFSGSVFSTYKVYNIGTGKGTSVLELLRTFEQVNRTKVDYVIGLRRDGDLPFTYCNPELAFKELGWRAEKTIEDICRDAWTFTNAKI